MKYKILIVFVFFIISVNGQQTEYLYEKYPYNYIRYDDNEILFPGEDENYERLWLKFDDLITKGEGKINIIHFGGSHIQGGIYSGQTRKRLQTFYPGLNAGRGLVFPYRLNRSNNPRNYYFSATGDWSACDNVGRGACYPGLLGIQAYTSDSTATLSCIFNEDYMDYDFNKLKIFHEINDASYSISFPDTCGNYTITHFPELDYSEIKFEHYQKSLLMQLKKTSAEQRKFTFYGVSFETDDPGIMYHDAGINGASLPSFNKCVRLEKQMAALNPDLVVISLGTNDTYTKNFKPDYYKQNYIKLIKSIRKASPNSAILMTVPNDSYYRKRYPNKNTAAAEKVIMETAKIYNCGVWDFYKLMGGLNSSYLWHKDGLMTYDRIHFTPRGYLIKGNLFFFALMKSYDKHIDENKKDSAWRF